MIELETPHGPARAHLQQAEEPVAALVLGHGAGGGIGAPDLKAATEAANAVGVTVALVEQPYRVAGRKSAAPAAQLDTAWTAVVEQLRAAARRPAALRRRPLVRRAGRVPHRRGDRRRRRALPRVPAAPARPAGEDAAAGARGGDGAGADRAGRERSVRDAARGAGARGSSSCAATTGSPRTSHGLRAAVREFLAARERPRRRLAARRSPGRGPGASISSSTIPRSVRAASAGCRRAGRTLTAQTSRT